MPRRIVRNPKRKNRGEAARSISHTESTNLNNQSESWDCPASAKRKVNPNTRMTSDRLRSLRSCRRLIEETETTPLPRSSREVSSAPDDNQQTNDQADTINSAHQVPEEGFDQVESPSRYLVSVMHPLIVEPELENEDAGNVENSTVGTPKVGVLGEAEMSLSSHSNQIAGQNTFEAESVPLEQEILAGEIQASHRFEEVTNPKCISREGCSSPSFSLNLTEMVEMWGQQADDGIDSEMRSQPEETINGYQVKQEFMPILAKIIRRHGDIANNCLTKSVKGRSALLEIICGIIAEFEENNISNINECVLEDRIRLVGGIKDMKVDVDWLHMRLIEVREAKDILKKSAVLKEKKESNRKLIEESENALEKCEAQKKKVSEMLEAICAEETACKERLARAKVESTAISITVGYAKSKVKRFLKCSVVNGLI